MDDFFSSMYTNSLTRIDDDATAKIEEIQRQKKAAQDAFNIKAANLESSLKQKFQRMIALQRNTEESVDSIDSLITFIMENSTKPSGKIENFDNYNLGKIDESTDWTRYDASYVSGYEVIGNTLVITLNYSYQNSGSLGRTRTPNVDCNYLTYLLSQKGLLFERINREGDSVPEVYNDVIDVFRIYCVKDIYQKYKGQDPETKEQLRKTLET